MDEVAAQLWTAFGIENRIRNSCPTPRNPNGDAGTKQNNIGLSFATEGNDTSECNNPMLYFSPNGASPFDATLPKTESGHYDIEIDSENLDVENNSSEAPSILIAFIKAQDWANVIQRCDQYPSEAGIWFGAANVDGSMGLRQLPIHYACQHRPPKNAIEKLLQMNPNGVQKRDSAGTLPIHLACRETAGCDVVELLLECFPKSAETKDDEGRLPLHLAGRRGVKLPVITNLLRRFYRGAQIADMYGLLPLHWSCSQQASAEVVESIIRAFPPATVMKDKWGRSPIALAQGSSSPDKARIVVALQRDESFWTTTLLDEIAILKVKVNNNASKKKTYKEKVLIMDCQLKEARTALCALQNDKENLEKGLLESKKMNKQQALISAETARKNTELKEVVENITRSKSELEEKANNLSSQLASLTSEKKEIEEKARHFTKESFYQKGKNLEITERLIKMTKLLDFVKEEHAQVHCAAERITNAMNEAFELESEADDVMAT